MHPACPYIYPIELLSRKWAYLVLRALRKPMGFSEIKTELRFVTNRMLSMELKILTEQDIVINTAGLYRLTESGTSLLAALEPLVEWSLKNKGSRHCAPEVKCSTCAKYTEIMSIRTFSPSKELQEYHI